MTRNDLILTIDATGEIKSFATSGTEDESWSWTATPLDLALTLVPSLVEAIRNGLNGERIVHVYVTEQERPIA